MKNIFLLPLSVILLTACETKKDKVIEVARQSLKDPKSFELIEYKIRDTTKLHNLYLYTALQVKKEANEHYEEAISDLNYANIFSTYSLRKEYWDRGTLNKKKGDILVSQGDSLVRLANQIKGSNKDTIVSINHVVTCFGTNSYNARVRGGFLVREYKNGTMEAEALESEELHN